MTLALGFGACVVCLLDGWNKSLVDFHAFRQTQTAISVYYFLQDGLSLDYETPVLGRPWSIPFEFPLYQWLVALLVKVSGLNLDQAGRAVSLVFWLACLLPLQGLLRFWMTTPLQRWTTLLLIWSTPTYLFWSRCFLIESMALFLALVYLYGFIRAAREGSWWLMSWTAAVGVLASLEKPTTFLIAVVPAAAFAATEIWQPTHFRRMLKRGGLLLPALAVPVLCTALWTHHADGLKRLNPLALDFLDSGSKMQRGWIYGTGHERISTAEWKPIIDTEEAMGLGRHSRSIFILAVAFMAAALVVSRRPGFRTTFLILIAAWLAGPLVFANLFVIHRYYFYETEIYLLIAFALSVFALAEILPQRIESRVCCGVFAFMIIEGLIGFLAKVSPMIQAAPSENQIRQVLLPLKESGDAKSVLLIYGNDWDPTIPYYSEHKALMDRDALPLNNPKIQAALAQLKPDERISAMVVTGPLKQDSAFIQERVKRFGLEPNPVVSVLGDFYLKNHAP